MAPLLQEKVVLEKEKKELEANAREQEAELHRKLRTIGNLVHDSVPVSDNEVCHAIFSIPYNH